MIADYSSEIKIAIFQSVSERQRAKWATIVKFLVHICNHGIRVFYTYNL